MFVLSHVRNLDAAQHLLIPVVQRRGVGLGDDAPLHAAGAPSAAAVDLDREDGHARDERDAAVEEQRKRPPVQTRQSQFQTKHRTTDTCKRSARDRQVCYWFSSLYAMTLMGFRRLDSGIYFGCLIFRHPQVSH